MSQERRRNRLPRVRAKLETTVELVLVLIYHLNREESRLAEFRARCARMRENTERELARLAQRRADVRAQIGVTSATMEQWKLEHQQILRDSQQR
ncbi:hypothetical protein JG687_00006303 [Phytophthora cactorum]|uniref:Uncharacterized protein n=1 Tax=Phytophthora cactorum TaxID=29920 RepID=A0A8T1UIB1_9STRA|nr:hypothetical protein JG687_00006303 [Phytophthora cactorum]